MGIVFPVVAIAFSHAAGDTTNEWAAPDFSEPPISRKMTFAWHRRGANATPMRRREG